MKLVRLLEWRRRRGLSQNELARSSSVGRPAISEYETLKREAHPATAKKLADALDVEVEDLLYREDIERPAWGKELGNVLKAARERGGYEEEIAQLKRFSKQAESGPGRSMYDMQRRELELAQAVIEMDLSAMPKRVAGMIRSYIDVTSSLVAAGVSIPAGLARSLVEALEREDDDEGEDAGAEVWTARPDDGRRP